MNAQQTEQFLQARISRRCKAEDRYLTRMERREEQASRMIGELCRNGKVVRYVCPVGGKYREGRRSDLIDFLIRNNYA